MDSYNIIITTCSSVADAERIAKGLLQGRIAACVQIMPVRSHYYWKGELANEEEQLLLIKAKSSAYPEIELFIKANHSYEIPEIIQIPITAGLPAYLQWINESTE